MKNVSNDCMIMVPDFQENLKFENKHTEYEAFTKMRASV